MNPFHPGFGTGIRIMAKQAGIRITWIRIFFGISSITASRWICRSRSTKNWQNVVIVNKYHGQLLQEKGSLSVKEFFPYTIDNLSFYRVVNSCSSLFEVDRICLQRKQFGLDLTVHLLYSKIAPQKVKLFFLLACCGTEGRKKVKEEVLGVCSRQQ